MLIYTDGNKSRPLPHRSSKHLIRLSKALIKDSIKISYINLKLEKQLGGKNHNSGHHKKSRGNKGFYQPLKISMSVHMMSMGLLRVNAWA